MSSICKLKHYFFILIHHKKTNVPYFSSNLLWKYFQCFMFIYIQKIVLCCDWIKRVRKIPLSMVELIIFKCLQEGAKIMRVHKQTYQVELNSNKKSSIVKFNVCYLLKSCCTLLPKAKYFD